MTVPGTTSYEYYQKVDTPYKEWHWFENSAHSPHLEEPDRFAEELSAKGNEILPQVFQAEHLSPRG